MKRVLFKVLIMITLTKFSRAPIFCLVFILLTGSFSTADMVDNRDGTVSDTITGLTWQKNASQDSVYTWAEAVNYCKDLSFLGYQNWRLPNVRELESLILRRPFSSNPTEHSTKARIDLNFFPELDDCNEHLCYVYWSSTTINAYYHDNAFYVQFYDGSISADGKWKTFSARCVRDTHEKTDLN